MCECAKLLQLSPTFGDFVDSSRPGSFVHGMLQARILEWGAMPFSKRSSQPKDRIPVTDISCIGRWLFWHHLEARERIQPLSNARNPRRRAEGPDPPMRFSAPFPTGQFCLLEETSLSREVYALSTPLWQWEHCPPRGGHGTRRLTPPNDKASTFIGQEHLVRVVILLVGLEQAAL